MILLHMSNGMVDAQLLLLQGSDKVLLEHFPLPFKLVSHSIEKIYVNVEPV